MKINTNCWYVIMYRMFYNIYWVDLLPSSLCPFFWKSIFMFITLPLSFPHFAVEYYKYRKNPTTLGRNEIPAVITAILTFAIGMLAFSITKTFKMGTPFLPTFYLGGLIIMLFTVGMMGGIATIVRKVNDRIREKREKDMKNFYLPPQAKQYWLIEGIKAIYGKYCPTIEWEKKKNIS